MGESLLDRQYSIVIHTLDQRSITFIMCAIPAKSHVCRWFYDKFVAAGLVQPAGGSVRHFCRLVAQWLAAIALSLRAPPDQDATWRVSSILLTGAGCRFGGCRAGD